MGLIELVVDSLEVDWVSVWVVAWVWRAVRFWVVILSRSVMVVSLVVSPSVLVWMVIVVVSRSDGLTEGVSRGHRAGLLRHGLAASATHCKQGKRRYEGSR